MNQQLEIAQWFDRKYEHRGLSYLRPIEAYYLFFTILRVKPGETLLDIACGPGLLLKAANNHQIRTYGIDISKVAIEKAREWCPEAEVMVGNAENLPYDHQFFDLVTCIGSLERMIDRKRALNEAFRVLKKGGKACFMVRNSGHLSWRLFYRLLGFQNHRGHQDAMDLKYWRNLFEEAGFTIRAVYPDHWPMFRRRRVLQPWRKLDPSKIEKDTVHPVKDYEFIFLLEK